VEGKVVEFLTRPMEMSKEQVVLHLKAILHKAELSDFTSDEEDAALLQAIRCLEQDLEHDGHPPREWSGLEKQTGIAESYLLLMGLYKALMSRRFDNKLDSGEFQISGGLRPRNQVFCL